ncbi:MAG TPA: UrcA family protein [Novosphingobium sp.]|nr:UrcA family protein [Novosphingobium sp.]
MKFTSIALAAALAIAAGTAQAETAVFRIDDLDLSTAAGKATFDARIEAAVRRACFEPVSTGTHIANSHARSECIAEARRQIVERLAAKGISAKLAG